MHRWFLADEAGFVLDRQSGDEKVYRLNPDGTADEMENPSSLSELAVTEDDPNAVYGMTRAGQIFRGSNQGQNWVHQGVVPPTPNLPQEFAINPNDQLHMIVTGASGEAAVTFDGGGTWMQSSGIVGDFTSNTSARPTFGGSQAQEDIWLMVSRRKEGPDGEVIREKFIARSTDGGLNFQPVVFASDFSFQTMAAVPVRPVNLCS